MGSDMSSLEAAVASPHLCWSTTNCSLMSTLEAATLKAKLFKIGLKVN
jgi:hypothetical protein